VDFTIEVERSLRVLDGAVRCSTPTPASSRRPKPSGVRLTSTSPADDLRQQDGQDRRGLLQLRRDDQGSPGRQPRCVQLPIGSENEFEGLIDLIAMKELVWLGENLGATWEVRDIRPSWLTRPKNTAKRWSRPPSSRTKRRWKPIWKAKSPLKASRKR
jgi:elongation factor G